MEDYGNLAALLGDKDTGQGDTTQDEDAKDGMDGQDSRAQIFASAAKEAFHALKENDSEGFTEALKAALGAC